MEAFYDDFDFSIDKIIMVHDYTFATNARFNFAQKRKLYGLVHILEGSLEYTFASGKTIRVCKGDTYLLTPDSAYTARCMEKCRHYTTNFLLHPQKTEGTVAQGMFRDDTMIPLSGATSSFCELFQGLLEAWEKKAEGYRVQAIARLYELLYHFIRAFKPQQIQDAYKRIQPAKEFIEEHWAKDFSVSGLASLCCLSTSYFRHLFFLALKQSPVQYRNTLRILHAKDLLLQEYYTITEIAYACGFDDPNYFSRFFKKETGISPRDYRTN